MSKTTAAWMLAVVAAIAAIAGVAAPWAAPRVAAVLIAVVACAYFAEHLRGLARSVPTAEDTPLRPTRPPRRGVPADLTFLSLELRSARQNDPLRPVVVECLRDLAAARIEDRHGLSVRDPDTHDAIRPLVSSDLYAILTRTGPTRSKSTPRPRLPRHSSLPSLIAEVERL
jgi:hypothetical protein